MDYFEFTRRVKDLGFISDDETADAAVKAVLGIFVSMMEEPDARDFCGRLPEPLTYETLVKHQMSPNIMPYSEYAGEVANQFSLNAEKADSLIRTLLQCARETVGTDVMDKMINRMPSRWTTGYRKAA